jgi:hypothetical protein
VQAGRDSSRPYANSHVIVLKSLITPNRFYDCAPVAAGTLLALDELLSVVFVEDALLSAGLLLSLLELVSLDSFLPLLWLPLLATDPLP